MLIEIIRANPRTFAVSVAGSVVFAMASVVGAIVLGRVTDDLIVDAGRPTVSAALGAGALIVGVAVVKAVGVVARRFFGSLTVRRTQRSWFNRLADHYVAQPLRFFQAEPTGKLLAHADTDAERSSFAVMALPLTLGAMCLLVFASISLAVLDPLLLLIGLALFPTLVVMNHVYSTRVEAPSARAQAGVGNVSSIAHESFEGALIVKLLGLENTEAERMRQASDELREERLIIGRLRAVFEPALEALPSLGTVALLAVGATRVDAGAITTGDLVQAMTLFGILSFPMRVMGFFLEELPRSVVSRDRLVKILDTDFASSHDVFRHEPANAVPLPDGPLGLEVTDVSFAYLVPEIVGPSANTEAPPVLDRVSFSVESGHIVAMVGSTGSGKSSLCTLLAGLARPTSGEIRLGGVPLAAADPAELRRNVAMVFQETFLFADTIRENLLLGEDIDYDTLVWAINIAQADFVFDLPDGLDTEIGERGVTLSGGQRQRIALARAMLRHPRLLLLDDATSAIDPVVEQHILDGLRAELDTTTLVVAHRVATIRLAERVIFIEAGRVAAEGTHDELLTTVPAYEALVRAYEQDEIA